MILGLSNERRRAVSRPEGGPSGLSDKGRWSTSWKSGAKSERAYAMEYFQKHFPSVPEPATRSRRWLAPIAVMGLPWGSILLHAGNSLWRGMYQQCTYLYLIENAKVRSKKIVGIAKPGGRSRTGPRCCATLLHRSARGARCRIAARMTLMQFGPFQAEGRFP